MMSLSLNKRISRLFVADKITMLVTYSSAKKMAVFKIFQMIGSYIKYRKKNLIFQ